MVRQSWWESLYGVFADCRRNCWASANAGVNDRSGGYGCRLLGLFEQPRFAGRWVNELWKVFSWVRIVVKTRERISWMCKRSFPRRKWSRQCYLWLWPSWVSWLPTRVTFSIRWHFRLRGAIFVLLGQNDKWAPKTWFTNSIKAPFFFQRDLKLWVVFLLFFKLTSEDEEGTWRSISKLLAFVVHLHHHHSWDWL